MRKFNIPQQHEGVNKMPLNQKIHILPANKIYAVVPVHQLPMVPFQQVNLRLVQYDAVH